MTSTPILPVGRMSEAIEFYERAGFGVRRYINPDGTPGEFAFVDIDGQNVFNLDVADVDPDRNHAACYLVVNDADAWHARLTAVGIPTTPLVDQPWGMREFAVTDPSGNLLRIGHTGG